MVSLHEPNCNSHTFFIGAVQVFSNKSDLNISALCGQLNLFQAIRRAFIMGIESVARRVILQAFLL